MEPPFFSPMAEAAFIAGLTDRQMNRVVDEHLVPEPLVARRGSHRVFTHLGAAFARFYFATEDQLLASARKQVLDELCKRLDKVQSKNQVLNLMQLDSMSWRVERNCIAVDLLPFLHEALLRAREVDEAHTAVSEDSAVLGGVPVFGGTRVPIGVVLGSLAAGIDVARLKVSYPFLTEAHIRCARVYETVHPRRGRPRRISEINPELGERVTRTIKRAIM